MQAVLRRLAGVAGNAAATRQACHACGRLHAPTAATPPELTADERAAIAAGWKLADYQWALRNLPRVAALVRPQAAAEEIPAAPDVHAAIRRSRSAQRRPARAETPFAAELRDRREHSPDPGATFRDTLQQRRQSADDAIPPAPSTWKAIRAARGVA
jgi:hypothetical protein